MNYNQVIALTGCKIVNTNIRKGEIYYVWK